MWHYEIEANTMLAIILQFIIYQMNRLSTLNLGKKDSSGDFVEANIEVGGSRERQDWK